MALGVVFRGSNNRMLRQVTALREQGAAAARQAMVEAVTALVDDDFDKRADPHDRRWAARIPPTGTWPLLEKTGRMRRAFKVWAAGNRIMIDNSAVSAQGRPYPRFHQTGTENMTARKIVPDGAVSKQGKRWRARIDRSIRDAIDRLAKGPG